MGIRSVNRIRAMTWFHVELTGRGDGFIRQLCVVLRERITTGRARVTNVEDVVG